MSGSPNVPMATTLDPYHPHHLQHPPLIITTTNTTSHLQEYRKGNWTPEETLILITAKKLDNERRTSTSPRPTGQLRWKWVETYCYNNGCFRTQNQCNDKWDNLLRDYKKVRDYEHRSSQSQSQSQSQSNILPSYWFMNKQQRKDRNLPSNMAYQIYQLLNDVVEERQRPIITIPLKVQPPVAPPLASEASDSSETDCNEGVDVDPQRPKVRDIGSRIVHSVSLLAKTFKSREEKRERRQREIMELEARRLQVQETQNEVNRQGIVTLLAAVENLSGAIQFLISDPPHQT